MKKIKYDFSGWITKYNVLCSDGRTMTPGSFKHMDGVIVPLVFQHGHNDIKNVLGKVQLEHRDEGVYGYASFNATDSGKSGKIQVEHGDLTMFSVFANQVKEVSKQVIHGVIREASLVLSAANPQAKIDNVIIAHDGMDYTQDDEITFVPGELITIAHADTTPVVKTMDQVLDGMNNDQKDFVYDVAAGVIDLAHADEKTLGDIYQSMDKDQKEFVYAIAAQLIAEDVQQSAIATEGTSAAGDTGEGAAQKQADDVLHSEGGREMNLFETNSTTMEEGKVIKHSELQVVMDDFFTGGSLQKSIIAHAGTYGIDGLSYLFPEARVVGDINVDERKKEWVKVLMAGINKVPWSRIKSLYADLTEDEARAKGYIKGDEKLEEVFEIFARETDPTTIYARQKLDNDDIIDIKANYRIVAWMKKIMDRQLDEEAARAILIGDGRPVISKLKIKEDKIRPIWSDDDLYTIKIRLANGVDGIDELEAIMTQMEYFEGESPVLFTTYAKMTEWKLLKDANENYRFASIEAVATFIGVRKIVECPVMKGLTADFEATTYDAIGIISDLNGYTAGSDEGGKKKDYEQFDIDFNQHKYLKEGRMSGAITEIRTSVAIMKAQAAG